MKRNGQRDGRGGISIVYWFLWGALLLGFAIGYFCANENGVNNGCRPGIVLPIETVITEGGLHG